MVINEEWHTVKSGGLFRCCIQSVFDSDIPEEPKEGQTLSCMYCETKMVWVEDAWQWLYTPER